MKAFRYRIQDQNGKIVFCNLADNEKEVAITLASESSLLFNGSVRAGVMKSHLGMAFGFSSDKDYLRSSQKFKTSLEVILNSVQFLSQAMNAHSESVNVSTRRLIHNLTSLNAHNIQEIYSLVPQELLASKTKGHIDLIQRIVTESPRDTAVALLALARANASMKTEFSVFKNLFNQEPSLQKKHHVVHKVLMNVLYLFFPDFTDKDVHVSISESQLTGWFDYESVHVALYHLIDNAAKYIKPRSSLSIVIRERDAKVLLEFEMRSLKIAPEEVPRLFDEQFSGSLATKTGKAGNGIGTFLIRKVLELNHGSVSVRINPESVESLMGIEYQDNTFEISLPRKP